MKKEVYYEIEWEAGDASGFDTKDQAKKFKRGVKKRWNVDVKLYKVTRQEVK